MADITGTSDSDFLPGTRLDDIIYGGGGDDVLNGISSHNMLGAGNDLLYGGEGNDTLYGGTGLDSLFGEAGNDVLLGGNDADLLVGGPGDDSLTGGRGDDVFQFNFQQATVAGTEDVTVLFRQGRTPDPHADYMAWLNYTQQLADWRVKMEERYGPDQRAEDTFSVDVAIHGSAAIKPAAATAHFDGDYSITYEQSVLRTAMVGEGNDVITDWSNGHDKLVLNGLSNDPAAGNYWGKWLAAEDKADGQTVITYEGGSVTLIGTDSTLADLITKGDIVFS